MSTLLELMTDKTLFGELMEKKFSGSFTPVKYIFEIIDVLEKYPNIEFNPKNHSLRIIFLYEMAKYGMVKSIPDNIYEIIKKLPEEELEYFEKHTTENGPFYWLLSSINKFVKIPSDIITETFRYELMYVPYTSLFSTGIDIDCVCNYIALGHKINVIRDKKIISDLLVWSNSSTQIIHEENIKKLLTNFATIECGAEREEYVLQQAKIDPHPVSKFRVNCTVMHIDGFYNTYKVSLNDKLYLPADKRAHIW